MSIAKAIMATTKAERDHEINRVSLKIAVQTTMVCRCGVILDVRRACYMEIDTADGIGKPIACQCLPCAYKTARALKSEAWGRTGCAWITDKQTYPTANAFMASQEEKKPRAKPARKGSDAYWRKLAEKEHDVKYAKGGYV